MPAPQSLTGGKLLFQRQTFRLSTRPVTPLAPFTRIAALPRRVARLRASGGALPHTLLPFVPKGTENHCASCGVFSGNVQLNSNLSH